MLDACVLINILASGRARDILSSSELDFAISTIVSRESIYLRASDPKAPSVAENLEALVQAQFLRVVELSGDDEQSAYVNYAADLDDGEAMTLALAFSRGFLVATDDRKARRIFLKNAGDQTRLLSTPQILKSWTQRARLSSAEVKELLLEISARGRFSPHPTDPEHSWWSNAIAQ